MQVAMISWCPSSRVRSVTMAAATGRPATAPTVGGMSVMGMQAMLIT